MTTPGAMVTTKLASWKLSVHNDHLWCHGDNKVGIIKTLSFQCIKPLNDDLYVHLYFQINKKNADHKKKLPGH